MGCGGYVETYIEPVINKMKLYIFGAGHIGCILADFAHKLDFRVTLIDERKEIFDEFSTENFNIIKKNHKLTFKDLSFDKNTFIASLSHKHGYDKEIIEYCAKQEYSYLGMIGSKRKVEKIKKEFLNNNSLTENQLQKIDWPMGVKIECQTPEEIAVSIIAKLIDVRGKMKNS